MSQRIPEASTPRTRTTTATVAGALTGTLLLAGLVAGCSGDDAPESDPTPSSSASEAVEPTVRTDVALGKVAGRLPRAQRSQVEAQVQRVVEAWIEAAYVGGDYPRSEFGDSWPGFTAGARAEAVRDAAQLSNRDIGEKIDGVEEKALRLRVDVLAARGRPAGATARVALRFDTTGDQPERYRVTGRLFLTRSGSTWKVFGYDVEKGALR